MADKERPDRFLIYGAYGYSGALIAQQAVEQGLQPVLAGRDASKLAKQARLLGLEGRVFPLDDPAAIDAALEDVKIVLHCAGPFIHTWQPMLEACLRNRTHYLDITGEYRVIENLSMYNDEAKKTGIIMLPGVGFDVVPSDCLAMHLKDRLPGATRLVLAFHGSGRSSRGTTRTAIESLAQPSTIRRGGQLVHVPIGSRKRWVDFGHGAVKTLAISWGDISSAFYSTGIPNIEVYTNLPGNMVRTLRFLGKQFSGKLVKRLLLRTISARAAGPSAQERQHGMGLLWGEVVDNSGRRAFSRMVTPDPYQLTALTAIKAVRRVLEDRITPGLQTPSLAFGKNFILEIPQCIREDII